MSQSDVRRELKRGWWRPRRGVLGLVRPANRDIAAALCAAAAVVGLDRSCVVSGPSAAVLHSIDSLSTADIPSVTVARRTPIATAVRVDPRTHIMRAGLEPTDVGQWWGVPVTTPARTVIDLGRGSIRDGVVAGDSALHLRLVTLSELTDASRRCARWPGIRSARTAIDFADGRAESALESITRWFLHVNDLPAPELQVQIGGYRVDMLLERERIVLEADGLGKYTEPEKLRAEKVRDLELSRHGLHVEHLIWADVTTERHRTADRVHDLCRQRRLWSA
jgi:very-short-patch-repair endonuclease